MPPFGMQSAKVFASLRPIAGLEGQTSKDEIFYGEGRIDDDKIQSIVRAIKAVPQTDLAENLASITTQKK